MTALMLTAAELEREVVEELERLSDAEYRRLVSADDRRWINRNALPGDTILIDEDGSITIRREPNSHAEALMLAIQSEIDAKPAPIPVPGCYSTRRDRLLRKATPPWANRDAIAAIYAKAKRISLRTGIPHQVDHEIPLQGGTVCGLHVETNLRVITAYENQRRPRVYRP